MIEFATSVLNSLNPDAFRLIVLCNGNNWAEFLCGAKIEECHFLMPCAHTHPPRELHLQVKRLRFPQNVVSHMVD